VVETALTAVTDEITTAKSYLTSGAALINTATRGENVANTYGQYGNVVMGAAQARINEALGRLRQIEDILAKYANEVTSYGSGVNAFANVISGTIGKFREQINTEISGTNNFRVAIDKYQTEINEQTLKISKFSEEVRKYQTEINEESMKIGKYREEVQAYQVKINEQALKLNKYGEQIQAYQVNISEQALKISKYQQEIGSYQAQIAGETLKVSKYSEEIRSYQAQIVEYQNEIATYNAKVNNIISHTTQAATLVNNYLGIAGRYLASGQAKINEMLIMLGQKPEFQTSKALSEQRA